MFKKLLTLLLLVSFLLVTFLAPLSYVQAQPSSLPSTWYAQEYDTWFSRVIDPDNPDEIFGERYTYAQVEWIIYSLITFIIYRIFGDASLIGCILQNPNDLIQCSDELIRALSYYDLQSPNKDWYAVFTERPLSGIGYFKNVGERLKIVPEAKAQQTGFGFTAASMIQELWRMVRNITYFLLVIVVVVMAFMIMFRVRLSPQTVISVQSALPRIIIALILITFSYAIAGFLIDLMYVVLGLITAAIVSSRLTEFDFQTLFGAFTTDRSVLSLMSYYFIAFLMVAFLALISNVLGFIGQILGANTIIWLIIVLVIFIVLLFATFRIWFMLIRSFVSIILLIVVGPVLILLGTLGYGGFGSWVRNIMSHLAVFAVVGPMFFMAFLFLAAGIPRLLGGLFPIFQDLLPFDPNPAAIGGPTPWIPPLTWGTRDTDILWIAVSIVVITLIPRVSDIIRSLIQGRPFAYGAAIGEAFGPARTIGGFTVAGGAGYVLPRGAQRFPKGSATRSFIEQAGEGVRRWAAGGFR